MNTGRYGTKVTGTEVVHEVVFFTWIGMVIFGSNANSNQLGPMIKKSFGAIFSFVNKGHLMSFNAGTVYFT